MRVQSPPLDRQPPCPASPVANKECVLRIVHRRTAVAIRLFVLFLEALQSCVKTAMAWKHFPSGKSRPDRAFAPTRRQTPGSDCVSNSRSARHIKQNKQEISKDSRNLYRKRKGENRELKLNPNAPDFIRSREQKYYITASDKLL